MNAVRTTCGYCGAIFQDDPAGLRIGDAITQHWYGGNCPKHFPRHGDPKIKFDWFVRYRVPQIMEERKAKHPMAEETKEALRKYRDDHADEIKARRKIRVRMRGIMRAKKRKR